MLNYDEYERLFNEGDDVAHTERFFTDDIQFITAARTLTGKAELYKFLAFAHDGVLERMRPQKVLQDGNYLFVEIDMDFHALKPRPEFPFGALMPGDMLTVKFFVIYTTQGDKVVQLRSATWPAGRGVSTIPRLGSHPSQVAALRAYLAAFSNADVERFTAYYADDVELFLGSVGTLRGKVTIGEFYRKQTATVRENIEVLDIQATDTKIVLKANARFTAIEDSPNFPVMPLVRGEGVLLPVDVHYELQDGLIRAIRTERRASPSKTVE